MKVFDLRCGNHHCFEGWFASVQDFEAQHAKALVLCPMCADAEIVRLPSASRLNLSNSAEAEQRSVSHLLPEETPSFMQVWADLSKRALSDSQDVGRAFADEARKMHYGESAERSIRGQASLDEARSLVEEGIPVLPLFVPESAKHSIH